MNFGGSNLTLILILLLLLGDNENGTSCDTLIWLMLLSKYCGGNCGCNGGNRFGFTGNCGN